MASLDSSNHRLGSAKAAAGGHGRWWGADSRQGHLSASAPFLSQPSLAVAAPQGWWPEVDDEAARGRA